MRDAFPVQVFYRRKKSQSGSSKSMAGDDSAAYGKSGNGKLTTIRHVEEIIGCESKRE
jgi:hypothetical protein